VTTGVSPQNILPIRIGIVGGSGLDDPQILTNPTEKMVGNKYSMPTSPLIMGKISGVDVVILARHGKKHGVPPTKVNFRANIFALKEVGCTHILATTAVGSLREEIKPGNLVFPDQFIDFTRLRDMTFFEDEVVHTPMPEPFDKKLRDILCAGADTLGYEYDRDVTLITIEGPRFSTKAESHMFRSWGADIINMSACPEVILANELGIPYQSIAMSTDYDCWKEGEESVTFEMILARMEENAEKVKKLLLYVIPRLGQAAFQPERMRPQTETVIPMPGKLSGKVALSDPYTRTHIKSKIRTVPHWPKPGVMFRDITTLLKDSVGLELCIKDFLARYANKEIDVIVGIDSRGFILGGVLAYELEKGFVPVRKKGKLPAETESETYEKEYGPDTLEIHKDGIQPGQKVLIVDDLIATGGTALATANLVDKLGGDIVELAFIVDLPDLGGGEKLKEAGFDYYAQVEFEGE